MFLPTFIPATAHLDSLFKEMQKEHNHLVIVINEYGETAGIVTMEDILEELVGEIWDECDEAVEDILSIDEKSYRVLCSTNVEYFFDFFSLEPSDETEAATVNGWIVEQLGNIPEQGFSFNDENLTISITKADNLMAKEIIVCIK